MSSPYRPYPAPMPMDVRMALPRDLTLDQARQMLAQAQRAYFNLLTGALPVHVETPQLGRVQFAPTTAADLQRLVDYLNAVVAAGGTGNLSGLKARKPFSFYMWP